MFRSIAALLGFILFLAPYSFSANPKGEYKDILARLIPPTINYSVTVEKNSIIKGFKQLNVSIEDKSKGLIEHKYLWVSKDKSLIIPTIVKMKNGRFKRVSPPKAIQRVEVDLSWFMQLVKQLPNDMKKSYGSGKNVYILSDPYCPFCKLELLQLMKLAKDNKIALHVIPYDVHGKKADNASLLFIKIEKEKNLLEALNQIGSAKFSDISNYVEKHKKEIKPLSKKYLPIIKKISDKVYEHGIKGTPAIIIPTKNNKGYLISGIEDISKYIK